MKDYNQAIQAYMEEICGRVPEVMEKTYTTSYEHARDALSHHLPTEMVGYVLGFLSGLDIPGLRKHLTGFAPVLYRLVRRNAYSLNHSVLFTAKGQEYWEHVVLSNAECNHHFEVCLTGWNCSRCGGYMRAHRICQWRPDIPHAVRCRCYG
jgi:hypothetical protein